MVLPIRLDFAVDCGCGIMAMADGEDAEDDTGVVGYA
jgi:hypothetical protein